MSSCSNLPDLWDLAQGTWEDCAGPSRVKEEAAQEASVQGIHALTDRVIVGVGRFMSLDVMAKMTRSGEINFIGCARPSIADPLLLKKIEEGRIEDIRECIGCNICITRDTTMSINRCTQNPKFMEGWRKGCHPKPMNAKGQSQNVLVVGADAGPRFPNSYGLAKMDHGFMGRDGHQLDEGLDIPQLQSCDAMMSAVLASFGSGK